MSVYSHQFICVKNQRATATWVNIPAAQTGVVRNVAWYNPAGPTGKLYVALGPQGANIAVFFFGPNEGYGWLDTRVVIPGGGAVGVATDNNPVDVTVSGYLLGP